MICVICSSVAANAFRCLTCEVLMCNDCAEIYQTQGNDKCLNASCNSKRLKVGLATAEQRAELAQISAKCENCGT